MDKRTTRCSPETADLWHASMLVNAVPGMIWIVVRGGVEPPTCRCGCQWRRYGSAIVGRMATRVLRSHI